ncbi:MAG TPA: Spy/CpxP family protein refolding chaperone [Acetobacteraceae bacterium]|nr:Spy/CpxP family protein refolding chaperone [Acetobacteraceae bacterium]
MMRQIGKALAVAAVVAALGGAGLAAVAQPAGPGAGGFPGFGPMGMMHGWGGPGGMMGGARGFGLGGPAVGLDTLKTELAIRPDQAAAWDAYVKAVQDAAVQMRALHSGVDFDTLRAMDWQQHQAFMAKLFDQRAAAYKSVRAAATQLIAALDDGQKTRLLVPALADVGPGMMGWRGGPMMGFGGGMMPWVPHDAGH